MLHNKLLISGHFSTGINNYHYKAAYDVINADCCASDCMELKKLFTKFSVGVVNVK